MTWSDSLHERFVFGRRVRVLAEKLAACLPPDATVLDVGAGDGLLSSRIAAQRPDLSISGIDVLIRPKTHVPVARFDGTTIPFPSAAFHTVLFVDVLHHTKDPMILLREAARVARHSIVIKDHYRDGFLAEPTLRFMDQVGNARHSVALPNNFWPRHRWAETFALLGLTPALEQRDLGLYPGPADWVFGRGLHFIARLERKEPTPGCPSQTGALPASR